MEIPKCLDRYVNDYQMHVFEVAWLTEEEIGKLALAEEESGARRSEDGAEDSVD
mgnify:CR=1 FL=1